MSPNPPAPSLLFNLPLELQLSIYELVVQLPGPLLLNCPCNSSYRGRYKLMYADEKSWAKGDKQPPAQPALTLTCRSIRAAALPIFYKRNIFRASYCYSKEMLPAPLKWLRMIGKENREALRQLYFYDRNERHDKSTPRDWKEIEESETFTELGGKAETFSNLLFCAHLVTFGDYERPEGQIPAAVRPGVKALKEEGEE
jgi:hypothetical protein